MKNYLSIVLSIMFMLLASSQTKAQIELVDKEAVKKEVIVVLDKVYAFFDTHEIEPYAALLCEDGLYTGTDKTEFWDKASLLKVQKEMFDNPEFKFSYKLTKRVIRVADDGKSALGIDQIEDVPVFGPDMPVRVTSYLIKTENGWMIDYLGWSLIPNNEDVPKIAEAIAK